MFSHSPGENLDVPEPDAIFTRPNLTTFTRRDHLGLEITGQVLEAYRAVLTCRVVKPDDWYKRCRC